jgi:hypothetical protein
VLSEEVKAIGWKAQLRLHARYRTLLGRGKCQQQVVTAVGRELLGFIWAIGVTVEREQQKTSASMVAWADERAGSNDAAEGHTERRILDRPYAVGLRAEPAPLVRGSSRRITIMRFRPANIRVINRRDSRLGRLRCCWRIVRQSS